MLKEFQVDQLYSNKEIYKSLQVSNAGGIRVSVENKVVKRAAIMTSLPTSKIARENPYHDRLEDGILIYTAAGKEGHQTLSGVNKHIPNQLSVDYPIHGFILIANRRDKSFGPKRWKYLGLLEYLRHYPDQQIDVKEEIRNVWIFEFKVHLSPNTIPILYDQTFMQEILKESRLANPSNEDDREILVTRETGQTKTTLDLVKIEALRSKLLTVDPQNFEHLIKNLLTHTGFENVYVTKYSQDGGIDVNAQPGYRMWPLKGIQIQIQAKRWLHSVGRKDVAELRGSLQTFARGAVVTTSYFTKAAIKEASEEGKNPITLVNGFELAHTMLLTDFPLDF